MGVPPCRRVHTLRRRSPPLEKGHPTTQPLSRKAGFGEGRPDLGRGSRGILARRGGGDERLTSEQQLPPPQVCLGGRVVAGHRIYTHASALEPVGDRPAARRHLESCHPQRRRRLQQHPAAQALPTAVRAARVPGQLQREAAHAPRAHGSGRGARRGCHTWRGPAGHPATRRTAGARLQTSLVSALVFAAPGAPRAFSCFCELCAGAAGSRPARSWRTSWSSASAP